MAANGVAKLELLAKANAGAIDQQLSDDMTKAEISTTVLDYDSMSRNRKPEVCSCTSSGSCCATGRAFDRIANVTHGWQVEALRLLFQA